MALFYECKQSCARKTIDTADIVRDGMLRHLRNRRLTQLSGIASPLEKANMEMQYTQGKWARVMLRSNRTTPKTQDIQRRVLSHGKVGRELTDHQR